MENEIYELRKNLVKFKEKASEHEKNDCFDDAIKEYQKALELFEKPGDNNLEGIVYIRIAKLYLKKQNYIFAIKYFEKAQNFKFLSLQTKYICYNGILDAKKILNKDK